MRRKRRKWKDHDEPRKDSEWISKRRAELLGYLRREGVRHGGLPLKPDWFVAPYLSIWRVLSLKAPGATGWWAICGDVPTDYISSSEARDAREAMRAFSAHWKELARCMLRGEAHREFDLGDPKDWPVLGDLLRRRAKLLNQWSRDDEIWGEGET